MYLFNITDKVMSWLPTFLQKGVLKAIVAACATPLASLQNAFNNVREQWDFRQAYTGQVFSLEELLNNLYDEENNITIEDTILQDAAYVGSANNVEQMYICSAKPREGNDAHIGTSPRYYDRKDFNIVLTQKTYILYYERIVRTVDIYKTFGRTYNIIVR